MKIYGGWIEAVHFTYSTRAPVVIVAESLQRAEGKGMKEARLRWEPHERLAGYNVYLIEATSSQMEQVAQK